MKNALTLFSILGFGWALLAAGVLLAIAAFLPWASALNGALTRNGLDGGSDGILTLVLGTGIAILGLLAGLRYGQLWVPIVAALASIGAIAVFFADYNDVSGRSGLDVGSGLWLTGVAAFACLIASICAAVVRV